MHVFRNRTRTRKPARRAAAAVVCGLLAAAALPATAASASPAGAATAASGSRVTAPPVPERYRTQRLDWHPCASGPLECASMAVPRDWYHPDAGPDLRVEVSRHLATDPAARRGVLMTAAGGPGASGLGRAATLAGYGPKLAAAYDIVSFDQRGVGASTQVVCSDQDKVDALFSSGDLRDRSPRALARTVERARDFVRDCERNSGGLLPYITTDQAAHDMDLYRGLLGADRISYFGASYATVLGAYYATEFPGRVERVVLDSNVDFTATWQSFQLGQPMSFQRRYEQDFLPWLAANDATYHQGNTPAAAQASYERLRAALREHPLDIEGTVITPNHLDVAASDSMYNAERFASFATLLGVLEHPEQAPAPVRTAVAARLKHPMGAAFVADYFAVTCADTPWNRSGRFWLEQSGAATRDDPLVGARVLTFSSICANWPRTATATPPVKVTGAGLPPVLMLNSTNDPATYYEAAVRAHRGLAGSRLLTVDGGDHGQYQNHNACVDGHVEAYLLDGALPAEGTHCPGGPLPVPAPTPAPAQRG
ncbi:alpha/beta hydrolase [Streptomyces sp. NBC_00536]|uniref:alpha/beta hydrolase n=1 Tax=Streptomyces sp. NBC_00536 TaxID=2975769 RepID=UPI002E8228E2|nr:alpha/beta hydrolase [Streptomyces sp. NBC_00536]WUC77193.1 alpha/beta hydrolase [Streptomyces sp. NBC_00536]